MCVYEVFSQVTFEQDSRQHYLKLLGYNPTELPKKVNSNQNTPGVKKVAAKNLKKAILKKMSNQNGWPRSPAVDGI